MQLRPSLSPAPKTPALDAAVKNVVWAPQPGSQAQFLSCPIFECLLAGTRGPGKTDALIMDFLQHVGVGWGPEWRGILFRQTYPQLDDVIAKTEKWIPRMFPGATYNSANHTWTFPEGEQLMLRHMNKPVGYWNYHGHAYPWIGWEELTNWPDDKCFRVMMSCCRSTVGPERLDRYGRRMPRKYRATTNPYGVGHNWVKRRYRLPEGAGRVIRDAMDEQGRLEPPRVAILGHISENKILLAADPEYMTRIVGAAQNPAMAKAWMDGDWNITSGGMFDDIFTYGRHVLQPFKVPDTWRISRTFDWGSSKPFSVGWWARSDGCDVRLKDGRVMSTVRGDMFRIAEWYGTNGRPNEGKRLTASQIAEGIAAREVAMGLRDHLGRPVRVVAGPADSAIWDESDGPSIAKRMEARVRVNGVDMPGVTFVKSVKGPGSRAKGWQLIRDRLQEALPPKHGGPRERPGMFVFATCRHWLEQVPTLPRDDKDPDDVDTDIEDHIGDETRYACQEEIKVSRGGRTVGAH